MTGAAAVVAMVTTSPSTSLNAPGSIHLPSSFVDKLPTTTTTSTTPRRSFVISIRETIHSISEWAKDPVLDNGDIAPCGGGGSGSQQRPTTYPYPTQSQTPIDGVAVGVLQYHTSITNHNKSHSSSSECKSQEPLQQQQQTTERNIKSSQQQQQQQQQPSQLISSIAAQSDTLIEEVIDTNELSMQQQQPQKQQPQSTKSFFSKVFSPCSGGDLESSPVVIMPKQMILGGPDKSSSTKDALSLFTCRGVSCFSQDEASLKDRGSNGLNHPNNSHGNGSEYDKYFETEHSQMRRLASWGTFATAGTDCTDSVGGNGDYIHAGSFSLDQQQQNPAQTAYDDDGHPIDMKLMERTRLQMEQVKKLQQKNRRKRIVKFDYPPITSLRQCPRMDPDDLPHLFFSEEELDMYEDDRRSTFTVDDVEIVAISTSLSEDVDPIIAQQKSSVSAAVAAAAAAAAASSSSNRHNGGSHRNHTSGNSSHKGGSDPWMSVGPDGGFTSPANNTGTPSSVPYGGTSTSGTDYYSYYPPTFFGDKISTTPNSVNGANTATGGFQAHIPTPKNNQSRKGHGRSTSSSMFDPFITEPSPRSTSSTTRRPSTPTPNGSKNQRSSSRSGSLTHNSSNNHHHRHHDGNSDFPLDEEKISSDLGLGPSSSKSGTASSSVTSTSSQQRQKYAQQQQQPQPVKKEKRLLKSVQIYLRERSTGL